MSNLCDKYAKKEEIIKMQNTCALQKVGKIYLRDPAKEINFCQNSPTLSTFCEIV